MAVGQGVHPQETIMQHWDRSNLPLGCTISNCICKGPVGPWPNGIFLVGRVSGVNGPVVVNLGGEELQDVAGA